MAMPDPKNSVDIYLKLAERPNTRRSYEAAVRHYEQEWHGLLPATPDAITRYLAAYASTLSINTLRLRLAGLSRWHTDHGFIDPTKAPVVAQVLKGIRAAHLAPEKQAKPIELFFLQRVSECLEQSSPRPGEDPDLHRLRRARDQAMLLIGFWRGFRADELCNLMIENISVEPGVGMSFYLPRSKGDRDVVGRGYRCPALSQLCPVAAYESWIAVSGCTEGPVFRKIDRWGKVWNKGIVPGSIVPWLRRLFKAAGVEAPENYSSHSLRRGFASWARSSGWDIKELMEYVGWKDIGAAMRYLDISSNDLKAKFEQGLARSLDRGQTGSVAAESPPSPHPRHQSPRSKPALKIIK